MKLKIEGMNCGHCSAHVKLALGKVPGVEKVDVNLAGREATIEGQADPKALISAVEEAGYRASQAE